LQNRSFRVKDQKSNFSQQILYNIRGGGKGIKMLVSIIIIKLIINLILWYYYSCST